MKITFAEGNVLSNEMKNKSGNVTQILNEQNAKMAYPTSAASTPKGLGDELSQTNPYMWNSISNPQVQGFEKTQLSAYLNQANMSAYYQNNPWSVLTHSQKYGIQEPLGGPIRGDVPPGSRPGNLLKGHVNSNK